MYYVYILSSSVAKKSYVGFTNDLSRRMKEHNSGRHSYTKRYMPWEIIHKEQYDTIDLARKREKYLKSAAGRKYLKKIFGKIK
jgi:putative endonuclease